MKIFFNAMPHIVREIRWSSDSVRDMCINCGYYTAGTNEAYQEMLEYVDATLPTDDNLYKVAYDIVKHSCIDSGQTEEEDIYSIMFNLYKDCVNVFFKRGSKD
jgi:hypothetical protein